MRRDRIAIVAAGFVALYGCGDNRTAGGTVSTEAGNAVAARILDSNGRPVPGVTVVARPSDAIDVSTSATWVTVASDLEGWAVFQLSKGGWTLEARFDSLGMRRDVMVAGDTGLADTLGHVRDLSGTVAGTEAGTWFYLPGLARGTTVQADGSFRFPRVPTGIQRIRSEKGTEWTVAVPGPSPVLVSSAVPRVLEQGHPLRLATVSTVARCSISDSLVPATAPVLVDSTGRSYPVVVGSRVGGSRLVWAPPLPAGGVAIGSNPTTSGSSAFSSAGGLRLAWVPDLARGCQIPTTRGLVIDSSVAWGRDSLEGGIVSTTLGVWGGTLDSGIFPDTGAFSASFRVRTGTQGIGQLWILDWSEPSTGTGLRAGIGADRLWVRWGSIDTSVALVATTWRTIAFSAKAGTLQVSVDGNRQIDLVSGSVSVRSSWSVRGIAPSGGVDLAWILAWSGALDPNEISKSR